MTAMTVILRNDSILQISVVSLTILESKSFPLELPDYLGIMDIDLVFMWAYRLQKLSGLTRQKRSARGNSMDQLPRQTVPLIETTISMRWQQP